MIPFNNSGVDKPDIPDHVIEYAMFRMARSHYAPINLVVLEGMSADDIYYHYAITSIAFKACTLRYTYLFDTLNLVEWFRVRLNRLTFLEMSKLPKYKQPPEWDEIWYSDPRFLYEYKYVFQGIESWPYFDDSMPRWIKTAKDHTKKKIRKRLALV